MAQWVKDKKITLILMSIIFLSELCWTQEEEDFLNHFTAQYRQLCSNDCHKHGQNYYWCNTKKGWDYCSLKNNTDYKGYECKDDHPCGLNGKKYYWCYTKSGSWGYCGTVEPKKVKNKQILKGSHYLHECKRECSKKSKSYYWCYTDDGWDYCSPAPDVTYKNEPCRSDHPCDTHDYDYSWCWTDSGWDYCGIIEDLGICDTVISSKRESGHINETCFLEENGMMIKMKPKLDPEAIAEGRKWSNEMSQIIAHWNNSYLQVDSKSNVLTTKNLRLDLQGLVIRDYMYYYGLQIEMNMHRPQGISTTLSQEEEDFQNHFTAQYKQLCYDACLMRGENYYWCHTHKGWDYCSLKKNTDYKGYEGKDDHPCELHVSGWDYCGIVEDQRICATVTSQKRESGLINETCLLDHFNRKMTKMKPNNSYLHEDSKSNVITTDNLCLDLRGLVLRDNLPYYGLQIEMNMHCKEHKSSIVAEVFLPLNVIPERHVHRAIERFCDCAKVFVTLSNSSSSEDNCVLIPPEDIY
ncbi:hypothetical protein Q7C36_001600 [Tachysurus vachellii]|uniref:Plasminogen n=1 Tax=Tachysurus vachellii TaxID=175792 RepID=A0AA88NWR8_TACVA|nr:hypothetical protein Q7C36_001600 [Tachysurus vachellii]